MKIVYLTVLLFVSHMVVSQNTNQFDANGKRQGVWKKNFEGTKVLRYEGQFNHGKEVGLFKFYKNIDGKASLTATKQFNDKDSKAYVIFYTSTGKVVSEGQMDGKMFIGPWKYYQKTSKKLLILENYNNQGQLEGDRFVYYKNGEVAQKQHFKNGQLDGMAVWYSEDKVLLKEYTYVNGQLDGPSKYYNSEGDLILEGAYKNGKKHGIWTSYENGKVVNSEDYDHPKAHENGK